MTRRALHSSVVVVGHDLAEIEREASFVIILSQGKVAGAGKPSDLITAHGRTWLHVTYKDGRREWIEGELSSLTGDIEDVEVHKKDLASVQRTLTR
jgi:ABC-type sulfate/molybdate transport systems ATPase subunit